MFYAIKNNRGSTAFEVPEPWSYNKTKVPDGLPDKAAYREFCDNFGTDHAFISGFSGDVPTLRCSYEGNNPPLLMHGIVVDYDAEVTQDIIDAKKAKPASEFMPSHVAFTFSGNLRAIWRFEKPLLLTSKMQYKKFATVLNQKVKFKNWFAGWDDVAYGDPCHYYEIGKNWQPLFAHYFIPSNLLEFWLYEAAKDIPLVDDIPTYKIPVEVLAAEVDKRWPNKWQGPFEFGRRGVRFWDAQADNDTAAIVREDGMQCFTGPKGFVAWREIFGSSFVEKFEADRMGAIREVTCYDGRSFWILREKKWVEVSKDDFGQFLRCSGFSSLRKGPSSETDRIENDIKLNRFVRAALPFVHMPTGVIIHKGEQHLNYSTVSALKPAPPMTEGKMTLADGEKYFPFLREFFTGFFEPPAAHSDKVQLEYFFAWLKHFYENALKQEPKPGQVVVIAGPPGRGKTFLSRGIVSKMVGGFEDAANFLVEGQQWTDSVCEAPIMAIDDSLATADPRAHLRFTSLLKKIVANTALTYNGKFKKQGSIPWCGRVMITSNLDPESLKILPNMEVSTLDKIHLFKAANSTIRLPGQDQQTKMVAAELPYFCRWLLDWAIPDHLISHDPRYYIKAYHHTDLHQASVHQGTSHIVFELILDFMEALVKAQPEKSAWQGRGVSLYREMSILGPEVMNRISVHQLVTGLGMLESRGLPIKRTISRGHTTWMIPYSIVDANVDISKPKHKEIIDIALPMRTMESPVVPVVPKEALIC